MTPFDAYLAAVRKLHADAGRPSARQLMRDTGISHTTVGDVVLGRRLCSWPTTSRVLTALAERASYDPTAVDEIKELWKSATDKDQPSASNEVILEELRVIRALLEQLLEGGGCPTE